MLQDVLFCLEQGARFQNVKSFSVLSHFKISTSPLLSKHVCQQPKKQESTTH